MLFFLGRGEAHQGCSSAIHEARTLLGNPKLILPLCYCKLLELGECKRAQQILAVEVFPLWSEDTKGYRPPEQRNRFSSFRLVRHASSDKCFSRGRFASWRVDKNRIGGIVNSVEVIASVVGWRAASGRTERTRRPDGVGLTAKRKKTERSNKPYGRTKWSRRSSKAAQTRSAANKETSVMAGRLRLALGIALASGMRLAGERAPTSKPSMRHGQAEQTLRTG